MSTTVSTLLQVTSTGQVGKTASGRAADGAEDFQSLLQSATSTTSSESSSEGDASKAPAEDSAVTSDASQDDDKGQQQVEADLKTGGSEGDDSEQLVESEIDSSDTLELSEAIVSYLTYSANDQSSAVIEVSQEIGVVVTQAEPVVPALQESQVLGEGISEQATGDSGPQTDPNGIATDESGAIETSDVLTLEQASDSDEAAILDTAVTAATSLQESGTSVTATDFAGNEASNELQKKRVGQGAAADSTDVDLKQAQVSTDVTQVESAQDSNAEQSPDQGGQAKVTVAEGSQSIEAATADTVPEPTESNPSASRSDKIEIGTSNAPERATPEGGTSSASSSVDNEPIPTADRVRFVQRVSRAFQSARPEGNEIQLKLSPPELGSMRLSITVEQGVVSAKVETETAAARNILLDNLPALRERLAEQEIRVEKFDVDVGRDGQQNDPQSQFDSRDRQAGTTPQSDGPSTTRTETADESVATSSESTSKQVVSESSLDVSI